MGAKHAKHELFGTWTKEKDGPFSGRFDHVLVQNGDHSILIFGGVSEGWTQKNDMFEYNFESHQWTEIKPQGEVVPPPMKDHAAVIHHGNMYVFGGKSGTNLTNGLWIFNSANKQWTEVKPDSTFPPPRCGHSAVVYAGKMLVYGGEAADGADLGDLWAFEFDERKWTKVEQKDAPQGRLYHTATVHGKTMLVVGGFQKKQQLKECFSFDLETAAWTKLADFPFDPRSGHLGVERNGKLLVYGGELGTRGHGFKSAKDLWLYDPETQKWTEIRPRGTAPASRLGHRGCILSDLTLVVCGGTRVEGAEWNPKEWFNDLWFAKLDA